MEYTPTYWELLEAVEVGMDCDQSPICASDLCEILIELDFDVSVGEVNRALIDLWKAGKLGRSHMYHEERQCSVMHYWGKEWHTALT